MTRLSFLPAALLTMLLAVPALAAEPAKRTVQATIGNDGVQRVDVLGGGYYFDPYKIIVKINVPVELSVRKDAGMVPHNIAVKAPEAGIDFDVDMEKTPKPIRFTPTKTGSYAIYCDKQLLFFASHREKGMEGVLEVVE